MSMTNDNRDERDLFSEAVRRKLENYQMPVEPDMWASIQASIAPEQSKKIHLWWWISSGFAAAVALLFVFNTVRFSSNKSIVAKDNVCSQSKTRKAQNKAPINAMDCLSVNKRTINAHEQTSMQASETVGLGLVVPQDSIALSTESIDSAPKIFLSIKASNGSNKRGDSKKAKAADLHSKHWIMTMSFGAQNAMTNSSYVQPAISSYKTTTYTSVQTNTKDIASPVPDVTAPHYAPTSENEEPPRIGTEVQPFQTQVTETRVDTINVVTVTTKAAEKSNVHYWMPMSFGVKMQRVLSSKLSVESGLVYSYLQTDYSYQNTENCDGSISIHYLGVPLTINYKLWSNAHLEAYIAAGGLIEKGLGMLKEETYSVSKDQNVYENTSVKGAQLSVNASSGVTYKFEPQFGIYLEPQLVYYFDCNQPMSIRTHQPLVFNLQLGLRYDLFLNKNNK